MPSFNKVVCAGLAGIFACGSINMPAQALTKAETMSLSYGQVKGSGLANRCPSVVGEETIALSNGKQYKITDLCIEPKSWQVSKVPRHFPRSDRFSHQTN
jgi:photosystem II oxygen-evolving enhancer protein 1